MGPVADGSAMSVAWRGHMTVVLTVVGLLAGILLLPTASDLLSLVRLPFQRPQPHRNPDVAPTLLFLVPAHDEELLLGRCLSALLEQDYPLERREIVVIADNCVDRTSDVAREHSVRVLERTDISERGKPFAIAWALSQLALDSYDAVVIVDADTEVDRGFAAAMATQAPLNGSVLQPFNDVRNREENALTRMAAVHSMASHGLSFRLKGRVGLNVPLSVGMCLGTDVLKTHGWRAYSVAEDWETYVLLTLRGVPIRPVPHARIYAQEARSLEQSAPQRRRWMAGKLAVLNRNVWPLITSSKIGMSQRLDAMAELSFPTPTVHLGVAFASAAAAWLMGGVYGVIVAGLCVASQIRMAIYTLVAIALDPEPVRAAASFRYLPIYAVWRIGITLGVLGGASRRNWVRTARHDDREAGAKNLKAGG
jgi:1,2-diacylglycerol 3-beta-glucosyltransferase